ncbi:hypothetical protein [Haloferax volcanii]|uniref:Uncharacterized protein n=3 Tax=Haloferax volcanii TaxID=2246 RepID=A0A384KIB1_HALVD|nr:hypothetical protein [Haloferax volcanii]ADE02171.1 uncharacterized protein HVO_A0024 [Haloferax volcanii DS2]ELY28686.1 hypothetical protein C498_11126 [Haloferax volcanii DS2]MBS8120950.1 hypothetical protein [Haloferax volcanii]MBS8125987.1 hypothetical protein [Haloferax volcanii]MBS8129840.1 hypothetical protein [Haloferax volcanii]
MTKFSLEIVADDDKVKINLPGDRTFGITSTSSGAAFIPDWNDRHFTWAADKDTGAPFHHITDETRDEQIAKVEYGSEDEYLFEMYSAYGAFGQLKPANWVNADYLWELDTDAYADVLEEAGVMERSEDRLWFSFTRLITYIEQLVQDKDKLVEFLNRVYNGVGRREAWESDSRLFFTPGFESLILQRPDGYVMELSMADPVNVFDRMRSARSIDVMCQLFDEPAFST